VLRFVQTRIIQSPSRDALSEIALAPEQSRTAFRTKTAHIVAHYFAGCAEVFRRALGNLERVRRDIEDRSVPSAGRFLAVATVTIELHNWFRCNFITNRAAGAATGKGFHLVTLKLMTIRQAATVLAVPYRFADRAFAFNASVPRSRGGASVTKDSRR
jgi:hypothetical protein